MPSPRSTWWLFTINSKEEIQVLETPSFDLPSPDVLNGLFNMSKTSVQFVCWSYEFATRHHVQGCIQMKSNLSTMSIVKSVFGEDLIHIHLDPVRRLCQNDKRSVDEVVDDVIAYCSKSTGTKEGSTQVSGPFTFGERLARRSNKRKIAEQCRDSPERMQLEKPNEYRRFFSQNSEAEFKLNFKFTHSLKPWQRELEALITKDPDPRSIIWVYGKAGNEGKSTYAKKLKSEGWFYTRGGKTENLFYSYGPNIKKHIVFDIPRSSKDYIQYGAIEAVKDGIFESGKYEPLPFSRIGNVHVVVMANFLPEFRKEKKVWDMEFKRYDVVVKDNCSLSKDRIHVIDASVPVNYLDRMPILSTYKSDGSVKIFNKIIHNGKPKCLITNKRGKTVEVYFEDFEDFEQKTGTKWVGGQPTTATGEVQETSEEFSDV